jgi:hypothetical protein
MDELKQLEQTGKYLFHGTTTSGIQEFVPKQATSFGKPDEYPAIFASEVIEPPIFMAVLGNRGAGGWSSQNKEFGFYASEQYIERAKQENWKGYVYVLPRDTFNQRTDWEWRSEQSVRPIAVYEVGLEDLSSDIKVMPHDEYVALVHNES